MRWTCLPVILSTVASVSLAAPALCVMCNQHRLKSAVAEIAEVFRNLQAPLGFPEGTPNVEPRESGLTPLT